MAAPLTQPLPPDPPAVAADTSGPVNILLVDDQPGRLLTYRAILEPLGERLVEASSGMEALKLLMEDEYAVILLDVNMPGMDGFETASLIHQHPRFEKTPIIFVTALNVTDMDRLRDLFEAFSRKREILGLLERCTRAPGVRVFIGEESGLAPLDACTVVTAPYARAGQVLGVLGVIGPTRMAYDRVIPIVQATADLLGEALNPESASP